MSDEKVKLISDEVPQKFMEWLLAMGCPQDKVPRLDNAKQMCRGQYYIVWRSLMEEVESKNVIKFKKQLVFIDDIKKCKKTFEYKKNNNDTVPEELSVWKEYENLKKRLQEAESNLKQNKQELHLLIEKVSTKLTQRKESQCHVQDAERRVLLLQKVSEQLQSKKTDLQETMNIAKSLSYIERTEENEDNLDKCITLMRRSNTRQAALSHSSVTSVNNATGSTTISNNSSTENEYEECMWSLVRCRGASLWPRVVRRRAALCVPPRPPALHTPAPPLHRPTAKSIVAHTAALHCSVALEAMKNKALIAQAQLRLAAAVNNLNTYLTGDSCEYLVRECERTRTQTRVESLKILLEELKARVGPFAAVGKLTADKHATRRLIANVDKNIITKKDELKRALSSLNVTDRKIANVRECLTAVFGCLQRRGCSGRMDRYKAHISLPQESIEQLQKFYDEKRSSRKMKLQLSFDLDASTSDSFNDRAENGTPTFADELKIYLESFHMDKNRKLVLENGEKLWIFETVESSVRRWSPPGAAPRALAARARYRRHLHDLLKQGNANCVHLNIDIDITSQVEEQKETSDKIKKRLNDCLLSLMKIDRVLDLGVENLEFWQKNNLSGYISEKRTVEGKTYSDYEKHYKDCLNLYKL